MANYRLEDARFTAIYERQIVSGKEQFVLVPFEMVRYNVDLTGVQDEVVVPIAQHHSNLATTTPGDGKAGTKIYEKVWIVDVAPFHVGRGGKHDFGRGSDEGGGSAE